MDAGTLGGCAGGLLRRLVVRCVCETTRQGRPHYVRAFLYLTYLSISPCILHDVLLDVLQHDDMEREILLHFVALRVCTQREGAAARCKLGGQPLRVTTSSMAGQPDGNEYSKTHLHLSCH